MHELDLIRHFFEEANRNLVRQQLVASALRGRPSLVEELKNVFRRFQTLLTPASAATGCCPCTPCTT